MGAAAASRMVWEISADRNNAKCTGVGAVFPRTLRGRSSVSAGPSLIWIKTSGRVAEKIVPQDHEKGVEDVGESIGPRVRTQDREAAHISVRLRQGEEGQCSNRPELFF